MRHVSLQWLTDRQACSDQLEIVEREWGDSVELSHANLRRAAELRLDLLWLADELPLSAESWRIYDEAIAEPQRIYDEAIAEPQRIYREAIAEPWRIYDEAIAEPRRIYREAIAEPWRIYDEAIAEPRRIYLEAAADALWAAITLDDGREVE